VQLTYVIEMAPYVNFTPSKEAFLSFRTGKCFFFFGGGGGEERHPKIFVLAWLKGDSGYLNNLRQTLANLLPASLDLLPLPPVAP
jgi:hypothetical protein